MPSLAKPSMLDLSRPAVGDFRRTWPQLLLADLLSRAAVLVLATPLIGLFLKLFLLRTEDRVLTDTDITEPAYNRTYLICQRLRLDCGELEASYSALDSLVTALGIPAQFTLADSVGKFRIFSFADPDPVERDSTGFQGDDRRRAGADESR